MGKLFSGYSQDSSPTTDDAIPTKDTTTGVNRWTLISSLITTILAALTASNTETLLSATSGLGENFLINGNMNVWQRNTTFTPNDDTYICDRWNCLQEANSAWTFARDTDVPATGGSHYSLKCSNVTLNNQCGIVQILEAKDSIPLFGKSVSLSFYAKTNSTEIAKIRAAILSWNSTEDVVTSDVIGTWAQNGTEPTWATNWTREGSIGDATLTSSWAKFTLENVAVDTASLKNVAVVIWVDDGTIAANDDFYVTQVQLNVGTKALPFQGRSFTEELQRCQRYYAKSYPYATVPGTADGYTQQMANMIADTAADTHGTVTWPTTMRTAPTITLYAADAGTGSGTSGKVRDNSAGGLESVTGSTSNEFGMTNWTISTTLVAGRAYGCNYVCDSEL